MHFSPKKTWAARKCMEMRQKRNANADLYVQGQIGSRNNHDSRGRRLSDQIFKPLGASFRRQVLIHSDGMIYP